MAIVFWKKLTPPQQQPKNRNAWVVRCSVNPFVADFWCNCTITMRFGAPECSDILHLELGGTPQKQRTLSMLPQLVLWVGSWFAQVAICWKTGYVRPWTGDAWGSWDPAVVCCVLQLRFDDTSKRGVGQLTSEIGYWYLVKSRLQDRDAEQRTLALRWTSRKFRVGFGCMIWV